MTKEEYAGILGVHPSTVSRSIAGDYERAIKKLQAEKRTLQDAATIAQVEVKSLQSDRNQLQAEIKTLQGELRNWKGQPPVIRHLASTNARTIMLFLLAAFEGVGSFNLLLPKGIALALPVSLALAFALLVFTASEHKFGKWFCIVFAVAVGGIYFDVFPQDAGKFLFAFTPPAIAALIAFSFKTTHK